MRLLCLCLVSLLCLLSCGLENFSYIDNIVYVGYDEWQTTIQLPPSSAEGYSTFFTNFIIFYRIYISDQSIVASLAHNPGLYEGINAALLSDYNSLYPLTDITSTTVSTTNLETRFANQQYFPLALEGADIENVLGSGSRGSTLLFEFPRVPGEKPTLTIGGTTDYTLKRAERGSNSIDFSPVPVDDPYFLNYGALNDIENAKREINADVATNTRMEQPSRYTYVSMYIAARGIDPDLARVYSQPTFVGIFLLAQDS